MNKSFENEYRQMMKAEAPELWDRISSSLPQKNIRRFGFRRFAGAIAACICAAILIPLFISGTRRVSSSSDMRYEAAAVVSENVPFEYAAEEAAEERNEGITEETAEEAASEKNAGKEEAAKSEAELSVKEDAFREKTAKKHNAWRNFKGR